jgi:catechol 2,3-dioxygenase-like lactoylglutathione lyase family enzyme
MTLSRLDHYNIETVLPEETVEFYTKVLGLVNAPERRPAGPVPGTWLLVNDHPAVHINFVEKDRAGVTGSIDHVAFEGSGFDDLRARLDEFGLSHEVVESPQIDLKQIFVRDPNGIKIEINIRNEFAG